MQRTQRSVRRAPTGAACVRDTLRPDQRHDRRCTDGWRADLETAEELLVPNGDVPLIVWMYQTAAERGLPIKLEEVT